MVAAGLLVLEQAPQSLLLLAGLLNSPDRLAEGLATLADRATKLVVVQEAAALTPLGNQALV